MTIQSDTEPDQDTRSLSITGAAAGGWPAVQSVGLHLTRQGIPLKGAKTLLATNQPDGFDCPGCAWPDRNPEGSVQFCENGAKAVAAEATARRATPELIGTYTVQELCNWTDQALEDLGRLTHPMRYDASSDRYVAISWQDAFSAIGQVLKSLPSPHQALFYTSGRTSNEAAFLYQLFVRSFGTNNLPDCSNMCHEPSGVGLKSTIGVGKGTVTLDDFDLADAIFSFGHNPGSNHPRMLGELRAASRRGAKIVAFNPLRERGLERFTDPKDAAEMLTGRSTPIASHYYNLRVGGDVAVLTALCKRVLELDDLAQQRGLPRVLDIDFIEQHTQGFAQFESWLREQDWSMLCEESGLGLEQLHEAARIYAQSRATIVCWGMGITQHRHAVTNVQLIAALMLMRGQIGRPGAGVCPVRGHSNVQGDRTMGIDERPSADWLDRMEQATGVRMPREPGFNTVEAIAAMLDGRARVFIGMGGNFAMATPDTERTHAALRQCELTLHISTKLNRSHLVHGRQAYILPCLGRTELDQQDGVAQAVTVEDSMSMVHRSVGRNVPASEHLRSEPAIVAELAVATLENSPLDWRGLAQDYARIRALIERAIPGFEDFERRVSRPGGFRLPNAAAERRWATPGGRACFVVPQQVAALLPEPDLSARRFRLATIRSHDQYNTTIYGNYDRYRGVRHTRKVVFIHPEDLLALGWSEGQYVDIKAVDLPGEGHGEERWARQFELRAYAVPKGCLAAYYPETNALIALEAHASGAGTPASKSVMVELFAASHA